MVRPAEHQAKLRGLAPEEELRATAAVSFRGALRTTLFATLSFGPERRRNQAFTAWQSATEIHGLFERPDAVIGVTFNRIVVCRTSFWWQRPLEVVSGFPLSRVARVITARHGLVTGMALALTNGVIFEVESMRGRQLRRFADVLHRTLEERASGA